MEDRELDLEKLADLTFSFSDSESGLHVVDLLQKYYVYMGYEAEDFESNHACLNYFK